MKLIQQERQTLMGRLIAVAMTIVVCFGVLSGVHAQDTPNPPPPEVESEGRSEGEGDAAEDEPLPPLEETLQSEHGLTQAQVDDLAFLAERSDALRTQLEQREARLAAIRDQASRARAVFESLSEQVAAEELPELARSALVAATAKAGAREARAHAEIATIQNSGEALRTERARLEARRDELREQAVSVKSSENYEHRREADARRAEEEALEHLRKAREREARERDDTLRRLLARERQLAEKMLALTREHHEQLAKLADETRQSLGALAEQKAEILDALDAFPADPRPEMRVQKVDPVFDRVVSLRRQTREKHREVAEKLDLAEQVLAEASAELRQAEGELENEERRRTQLGTEVAERRSAVARGHVELATRRVEAAREVLRTHERRLAEYDNYTTFFNETLEQLLPLVSDRKFHSFFALDRDDNWRDAMEGLREGIRSIYVGAERRWEQLFELPDNLVSWELWSWVFGFCWRLLLVLAGVKVLLPLVPTLVNRLTGGMLRRRFFRARPALTIKVAELLRALARPLIVYAALMYVGEYVALTFSELRLGLWLVNAFFIYWAGTEIVQVLVLPRWYRREQGRASAEAVADLDETEAAAIADIVGMELARAKKLVRSARVILLFWVLSTYIPDFIKPITGITVIWWLVDRVAVWGLAGVVYWVISTWRDDIASIFARLARDRMPRAVTFVNSRKDAPYGVLVIGVASVYVIVKEMGVIARKYVLNTESFKRASNFAFRKKIEMRARERDVDEVQDAAPKALPDEFLAWFEDRPLEPAEPVRIARPEYVEVVEQLVVDWRDEHRQGSVALVGETGIGKTTLLNEIAAAIGEHHPWPVRHEKITHKFKDRQAVLKYVAELFELEGHFPTQQALIEAIRERETRVVVLDDCHHFFIRQIGGFEPLQTLLDIVNLTDEDHFWVLSFNIFAWNYVNRVSARQHYFGRVLTIKPWSEEEIQNLVKRRCAQTEFVMSFSDLMLTQDARDGHEYFYEIVKTERGYYRYLHEFSGGNPRLAMLYWLRSLRQASGRTLQVKLFRRPSIRELEAMSDNHWFVLASIEQHGELDAAEIAHVINIEEGFVHLALNFFQEKKVITINPTTGRARLTPLYFKRVLRHLSNSNFLYT